MNEENSASGLIAAKGIGVTLIAMCSVCARQADDVARIAIRSGDDFGRAVMHQSDDLGRFSHYSDDLIRGADDFRSFSPRASGEEFSHIRNRQVNEPEFESDVVSRILINVAEKSAKSVFQQRQDDRD